MKTSNKKKIKINIRRPLPGKVVAWINEVFQDKKGRSTAYKYAFAAHIQVQKTVQRKEYGYICLPKSTLKKHITDKGICRIKKVFAENKVVFPSGWKRTINNKWMTKYGYNEEMFLSSLVKVGYWQYQRPTTSPKITPPPRGEGGVYMWRNIPGTGHTDDYLITKKYKTMKKKIDYKLVVRLINEGVTYDCIANRNGCSTKTIQRIVKKLKEDKGDNNIAPGSSALNRVDSAATSSESPNKLQKIDLSGLDMSPSSPKQKKAANPKPVSANNGLQSEKLTIEQYTLSCLSKLKIDTKRLELLIPERVKNAISSIQVLYTYQPEYERIGNKRFRLAYRFLDNSNVYRGWSDEIRKKLEPGQSLIKYNQKYYVGSHSEFAANKKKEVEFSLRLNLQNLSNPDCYRAHINKTNGRLDTTLTNLWGGFKSQILSDNNLCEMDIVNSQISLLSTLLNRYPLEGVAWDLQRFNNQASYGIIYEEFADNWKIDRAGAKAIMFHVLFSSHRAHTPNIEIFKNSFPTVYNFICDWKKLYGDNSLAIKLQNIEATIMINGVLQELMEKNIFGLTIHDSVVCKIEDAEVVKQIMEQQFEKNKFYCQIRSTHPINSTIK